MNDLDGRLLDAHARKDLAALVDLYRNAAHNAETDDARAFYLTHAHIFALEIGHADTSDLRTALIAMGRETPL